MCVQKPIRDDLKEDPETGEYIIQEKDNKQEYEKFVNRQNSILLFQWGCQITSYACRNLILGLVECVDYEHGGECLYCDTDSCYATKWDLFKLACYNAKCEEKLQSNGYGAIEYKGKKYCLGQAVLDNQYTEYKVLGAKRYCGRSVEDNELHITVAGVPKGGAKCLNNDINNFSKGFIFPGSKTGKLIHTYIYVDEIYINEYGDEVGDSIDLSPCDYLLDDVYMNWLQNNTEEVTYYE